MQPYSLLVLKHMLENMVTSSCTFRSTQIKSPERKYSQTKAYPIHPLYMVGGHWVHFRA